jgi:hypothetical protein
VSGNMIKLRVFEIKDKTGRTIYLTKERWAHIQKHPEMSDQAEQVKDTLRYPDKIMPFSYDAAVSFYYRYYKEKKQYLFISVKYLNGEGFVITSFYTDKIK